MQLPDVELWINYGILYLHQFISNGTLKSFNDLTEEFSLPPHMLYRYLQVKHAMQRQFRALFPQCIPNALMAMVKDTDPRKLISAFYNILLTPAASKLAYGLKPRWERAIGPLEDEGWEEGMESPRAASPKLSDRLIQIFVLHQAYLTPLRVARYRETQSSLCLMCGKESGTFIHLMWSCPQIQGLWTQVVKFLHDNMGSLITLDPKLCLLGILPESIDKYTRTFLQETLFSVRKVIARKWMRREDCPRVLLSGRRK